jgi:hypothetical protein
MVIENSNTKAATVKTSTVSVNLPDKSIVVGASVASQLHHEGKWPPNDVRKIMGSDYHYDQFSMANFLAAVQWNLAHGNPSYDFQYDGGFVKDAIQMAAGSLMIAIDDKTS